MLAFACGTLIQSPVKPCPHPAGTKDLGKGTTTITDRVPNFLWRKGEEKQHWETRRFRGRPQHRYLQDSIFFKLTDTFTALLAGQSSQCLGPHLISTTTDQTLNCFTTVTHCKVRLSVPFICLAEIFAPYCSSRLLVGYPDVGLSFPNLMESLC